jgi:hypothetical protein
VVILSSGEKPMKKLKAKLQEELKPGTRIVFICMEI